MIEENEKLRSLVLEACRGLAAYGLGSEIGGYVSVRYPNKPFFYMHVFERTFEEMQLEDIILFDFEGKSVSWNRSPRQGIESHHGISKPFCIPMVFGLLLRQLLRVPPAYLITFLLYFMNELP